MISIIAYILMISSIIEYLRCGIAISLPGNGSAVIADIEDRYIIGY